MSEAAPARERLSPRRSPQPSGKLPWPWHDRSGRFSRLKAAALLLEATPAAWIAFALLTHRFGARPITEAIHETGLWAIRFVLLGLLVTPVRLLFQWPRLVLVRRQLGLAALCYALAHVVLYSWDQGWHMQAVSVEILRRVYLEVGLVALVGLAVLGITSTDRALRGLGSAWKRLHKLVYGLAAIALLHYFLQSKANVAGATLAAGLFLWLAGWRLLPSGPDREPLPLLALSLATAALTIGLEYGWYALATSIPPLRAVTAEADIAYGPHPAGQVLLVCLALTLAAALSWAGRRDRLRQGPGFDVALYAGWAAIVAAVAFAFNLADDWLPETWAFWQAALGFVAGGAALGLLRSQLRQGSALYPEGDSRPIHPSIHRSPEDDRPLAGFGAEPRSPHSATRQRPNRPP